MSKKYRAELEAMTADEVTEKLGDFCESISRVLSDKETGTVKTLFNKLALVWKEGNTLINVAAIKNGVDIKKIKDPEQKMLEIATVVRARDSHSADKIWDYIRLYVAAHKTAVENSGHRVIISPLTRTRLVINAYKKLG